MSDRDQLYTALRNADAAGDTEAATKLASYIKGLPDDAPAETKPTSLGRHVVNLAAGAVRGAGSIGATILAPIDIGSDLLAGKGLTLASNNERRASMDAALKGLGADTDSLMYKGGKLGAEVAGTLGAGGGLASLARAGASGAGVALAPGANALLDAVASGGMRLGSQAPSNMLARLAMRSAGGAIGGGASAALIDPSTAGTGALIGAIAPPVLMGANAAGGGVAGIARTIKDLSTQGGQERVADSILRRTATNPQTAAKAANAAAVLVPGSRPTTAQVAQDPGLAQLERTLFNNPDTAGALNRVYDAQRAARGAAIDDVAATLPNSGSHYDDIKEGRRIFANEDYAKARDAGIDPEVAKAFKPQIDSLLERPSIKDAITVAKRLAAETGEEIGDPGSVRGLDWVKKALDNQIDIAKQRGGAIGSAQLDALQNTSRDLNSTLEQISPLYNEANRSYAKMSQQVNSMDVARSLDKVYTPVSAKFSEKSATEEGSAYMKALSGAMDSVKKSTGQDVPLSRVMKPDDYEALQNVARDLANKSYAQSAGKAVGSNTAQNMLSQQLLSQALEDAGVSPAMGAAISGSTLLNTLLRPVQFAGKLATPGINNRLAELMTDPKLAAAVLQQQRAAPFAQTTNPLAAFVGRGLPAMGASSKSK